MGRGHRWRQWVGAVALIGMLQHVWILALHTTSPLLAQFGSTNALQAADQEDCPEHRHAAAHQGHDDTSGGDDKPKTSCPICLGIASLHLAVLNQPAIPPRPEVRKTALVTELSEDEPPQHSLKIRNRGPPLLA
jgi:hypothetical protein